MSEHVLIALIAALGGLLSTVISTVALVYIKRLEMKVNGHIRGEREES